MSQEYFKLIIFQSPNFGKPRRITTTLTYLADSTSKQIDNIIKKGDDIHNCGGGVQYDKRAGNEKKWKTGRYIQRKIKNNL